MLTYYVEIDNCVNHTCHNGGSCVNGASNYSCNCSAGYTGDHCETGKVAADVVVVVIAVVAVVVWCYITVAQQVVVVLWPKK